MEVIMTNKEKLEHAKKWGYPVRVVCKSETLEGMSETLEGTVIQCSDESDYPIEGFQMPPMKSYLWKDYSAVVSVEPLEPGVENAEVSSAEKVYLTGTHPYAFRFGEQAEVIGVEMATPPGLKERPVYRVKYADGEEDTVVIHDSEHYDLGSVKEPEPHESGILGEDWHVDDSAVKDSEDCYIVNVTAPEWHPTIAALPDISRALKMVKMATREGRGLGRGWNVRINRDEMDKIEAVLKKAGIE